jgi:hypothetical protein
VNAVPVAVYCICFVVPAVTWIPLASAICSRSGVRPAAGWGKQAFSAIMNLGAVGVAFLSPWTALGMVALVASVWLLPPRRIVEKTRANVPAA